MADLRAQFEQCLRGRVALMGIGNPERGDDGAGVRLAGALRHAIAQAPGPARAWVVVAETTPERHLGWLGAQRCDNLVFLDAVDVGAPPGSAVLLNSAQMTTRFPQLSTHRLSLGLLAQWAEANGVTRAWLLGVQPESLAPGGALSPAVQHTLEVLQDLLSEALGIPTAPAAAGANDSIDPKDPECSGAAAERRIAC